MTKKKNILKIYPTSRAIREINKSYNDIDMFLPNLMRVDEFEARIITVEDRILVDSFERIFLLKEVVDNLRFSKLKYNTDLVHFFTQSDSIFKFFEELSFEKVGFESLKFSDTYGEFEEHIEILERLFIDYRELLESKGLTDRAFLLQQYILNESFIGQFDIIEFFIEGYLSNFEFELIERISKITNLILYFQTSRFTQKMQERFRFFGLELDDEFDYEIDFTNKKILSKSKIETETIVKVISAKERFEQIALAFMEIQKMVESGIDPDAIAIIVPDESIKNIFHMYDKQNNLNFAMGFDYRDQKNYKILQSLQQYWKTLDEKDYNRISSYGLSLKREFDFDERVDYKVFFGFLDELKLLDCRLDDCSLQSSFQNDKIEDKYFHISMVFKDYTLSYKEWLHLWLNIISDVTIDDIGGGKITVIDALESRGVSYDGLVIVDFNEGIVPSIPSKDDFLNSAVREFASLPTKSDREALQKQIYKRAIERSKRAVIIYSTSEDKLPSKFIHELEFKNISYQKPSSKLFYDKDFKEAIQDDIEIPFDPFAITWSASRLKIFLECKRKYYYKYIKNIKQKASEEENEGSLIHKIFEKVFKNEEFFKCSEDLSKKISYILEETFPKTPHGIYQKLLYSQMLKGFVENQIEHFKAGWRVVFVEKVIDGDIGGLKFQGRCDRIDQDGSRTFVLDYKTSRLNSANKSRNIESLKDFQMNIYKEILQSKYKNLKFSFVKVFEDGIFEEIKSFEEKDRLFFEAIDALKKTKSFMNSKCEDLKTCEYCEFALMCQRGSIYEL